MPILSRLAGTFQTAFQLGKGGPKLKNNSGALEARNAADTSYATFVANQSQFATALVNANAQIKASAGGQVTFRDAADSANAKVFAADPLTTDTQALTTVNYINNNPPTTANTVKAVRIASGSYAATYTSAAFIPNNAVIMRCVVSVSTAIDVGLTITVGTDEAGQAARFMGTGDNDPQTVDSYETTPFSLMKTTGGSGSDQKLLVTVSGTPTVGTISILVEYVVPTAW